MTCFWDKSSTCRHPTIGNSPATPERCGVCPHFRLDRVPGVKPSGPQMTLPHKVMQWAKAEASLVLEGPVSSEVFIRRLETCNGCEQLERASDPLLLGWCKACGCGKNKRAELTVKGRMPKATCPLNAWENDSALRVSLPDTLNR